MARDDRIRARLFPGAVPFNPKDGGYTSVPYVLRRAQWLFDPRAWQVYTYILMRLGPKGLGWITLQDLAYDLNFRSIPKLRVYVQKLVDDGWLLYSSSRAREYFFAPHPVLVLQSLAKSGKLPPERIEAIDEVLESVNWQTLDTFKADEHGEGAQQDDVGDDDADEDTDPRPLGPVRGIAAMKEAAQRMRIKQSSRTRGRRSPSEQG